MKKLKNKSIWIIFFIFSIVILNSQPIINSDYVERKNVEICGNIPDDLVMPDINNNPNYIFENDTNYEPVKLWDEIGNTVFVNSLIECLHYTEGGWNYFPKKYDENVEFSELDQKYKNFVYMFMIAVFTILLNLIYYKKSLNKYFIFFLSTNVLNILMYFYQLNFTNSTLSAKVTFTAIFINFSIFILKKEINLKNIYLFYLALSLSSIIFFSFSNNENQIFFQGYDNFGDTINLISSYEYFYSSDELQLYKNFDYEKSVINNIYLNEVKNNYCENNFGLNYENKENINPICIGKNYLDTPRNYSLPPLYLLITTFFGLIFSIVKDQLFLISILIIASVASLFLITQKQNTYKNKKLIFLFQLLSFPFLFAIQRGNFISVLNYFLVFVFLFKVFNLQINNTSIIALSLAINLRPNQALLLLVFFIIKDNKKAILLMVKTFLISTFVFFASLFINEIFHKDYSLDAFLKNLLLYSNEVLNQDLKVFGYGDGFSSSLYGLLKIFNDDFLNLSYNLNFLNYANILTVYNLNNAVILIVIIGITITTFRFFKGNESKELFLIKIIISSLIVSPKIGDYHLLILLIPFLVFEKQKIKEHLNFLILIAIVLMPKPHSFEFPIYGISLSLIVNSVILLVILFSTQKKINK